MSKHVVISPMAEKNRIEHFIKNCCIQSCKNRIVMGVSGGIDSAVVLNLCVNAIGSANVHALFMPADFTVKEHLRDISHLCSSLNVNFSVIQIEGIRESITRAAYEGNHGLLPNKVANGNLYARIRMMLLYYYANLTDSLVCGTGNKSEYMVGYFTKHGDAAADLHPILHLYKTDVYELAYTLRIPEYIINRPPSAGLWEGQTDEEELGITYDKLDNYLRAYEVDSVRRLITDSEHKRKPAMSLLGDSEC